MALTMNADEQTVKPPVAKKVPKTFELHGDKRADDYGWLREKASPETVAYLEAENAYAASLMKPHEAFVKSLYDEMLGRIKQTDQQVPYRKHGYYNYMRTEEGKQYPIIARKKGSLDAPEEILIEMNKLAEGHKFMSLGGVAVSDDGNMLAWLDDNTGYRQYKLHVKDLRTGEMLPDTAQKASSLLWAADNKTLFYTVENDAKRQWRLYRHVLGKEPVLVYEEKDELFDLYAERSRSGDFIFVTSDSKTTNEVQLIPAAKPETAPVTMIARKTDHKYYPEHHGDTFFFMTNDAGINYRVVKAPALNYGQKNWVEVVPYKKSVRIESVDAFKYHLVVRYREGGLPQFQVIDLRTNKSHTMTFPEPAYSAGGSVNEEFDTNTFRYSYQSLVTPASTYDYDLDSQEKKLLKRTEVLGGFDPEKYKSERIWATAKDGTKIPISLVYKRSIDPRSGSNPTLLYAYGSYGSSSSPNFSSGRLALLDRGVIYAIAHIRGGGDMGKEWHEQGRMMTKVNTFTDFIAAAEHLVKEKYTSPQKLAMSGGSAGGLLMGTVANMRPDLFKAATVYVPFVDVINTMLDSSLPLTTQEYLEWGNPNDKASYTYMKSYDPYSNIGRKKYPAMLVRTSLNDSQVGYWEAAKWVAKLRANKTDENPLVLLVNMGAGHGGSSGRYDRLKEDAFDYAWLLTQFGITK
jgi:oligopeptidase B